MTFMTAVQFILNDPSPKKRCRNERVIGVKVRETDTVMVASPPIVLVSAGRRRGHCDIRRYAVSS